MAGKNRIATILDKHEKDLLERRAVAVLSKESFTSGDALVQVRRALTKAGIEP